MTLTRIVRVERDTRIFARVSEWTGVNGSSDCVGCNDFNFKHKVKS